MCRTGRAGNVGKLDELSICQSSSFIPAHVFRLTCNFTEVFFDFQFSTFSLELVPVTHNFAAGIN